MHHNKNYKKKHSRKYRRSMSKRLPMIKKSIKNIGSTVETIALKSAPVVKTGVSKVFEILAKSANVGLKGLTKRTMKMRKSLRRKSKRNM